MQNSTTEQRNPQTTDVDRLDAFGIATLMNAEDSHVAEAVQHELEPIATAIDKIVDSFNRGGRLFYIGAGTSGRLGVLDASECPPTFNSKPELVVGLIAGGAAALTQAIEGAEDDPHAGVTELQNHAFEAKDVLVGIATSGRTPYVLGAVKYANSLNATTIGVTCNNHSELHAIASITIAPVVGPEIITGSTRLKAGTATKMVLNMLTTGAMILIGKTYGNLMVDLRATNSKLKDRSVRIVSELTELDRQASEELLRSCDGEVKTAIVADLLGVSPQDARHRLEMADGKLRVALAADQI